MTNFLTRHEKDIQSKHLSQNCIHFFQFYMITYAAEMQLSVYKICQCVITYANIIIYCVAYVFLHEQLMLLHILYTCSYYICRHMQSVLHLQVLYYVCMCYNSLQQRCQHRDCEQELKQANELCQSIKWKLKTM